MVTRRPWKKDEVPQILLQARPAFRHSGYRAFREELNAAQTARGFFGPRRGAGGREQRPRMKRSRIQQLKLRYGCARCRKLGHWARECHEGNRGQRNDERCDRRAGRPEDNSKGFIAVAGHTERRPFFLGASWTFVALDLDKFYGILVPKRWHDGKQQLKQWCKLLAEYGVQVEWSEEKPESACGIGGATQPIGVVHWPVGLAGCNGVIRFTVVEQDVPPLLRVECEGHSRPTLDLDDNGDRVIFLQFGGESTLRTWKKWTHGRSCRPI